IAPDGTVLGDSDHEERTMDNHLDREEVREALGEGIGSSIRKSETLNENRMYVAKSVERDGQVIGYIRLSMSLGQVNGELSRMWGVLVLGLLLLFAIAAGVSYRLAQSVTRPLE